METDVSFIEICVFVTLAGCIGVYALILAGTIVGFASLALIRLVESLFRMLPYAIQGRRKKDIHRIDQIDHSVSSAGQETEFKHQPPPAAGELLREEVGGGAKEPSLEPGVIDKAIVQKIDAPHQDNKSRHQKTNEIRHSDTGEVAPAEAVPSDIGKGELTKDALIEPTNEVGMNESERNDSPKPMSFIGRWRFRRALRRQAKIDYELARGTIHKRQIQACLSKLGLELKRLRAKESQEKQKLKKLDVRRQEALRSALSDVLVRNHLTDINGIGPQTAARILKSVYRGKLADLHHSSQRIQGIGNAKQAAISLWVSEMERRFDAMLEEDFPGKDDVLDSFRSDERLIQGTLRVVRQDIADLEMLKETAEKALDPLMPVSALTYYKRLRGEGQHPIEAYSIGVFPPWERPPTWFARLLNDFGG